MGEVPREPPADVPDEHSEAARELQLQLLVLEARLDSANFEDKAAYRRKINEKRGELEALKRRGDEGSGDEGNGDDGSGDAHGDEGSGDDRDEAT